MPVESDNESPDNELRMSLGDHLSELRSRLIKCLLAIFALGGGALLFARPMFGLLMRPVLEALPPERRALIYTSGIEELNVLMKVGVYGGIFLAVPVMLWQLWGFISPGLYPQEKRYAGPFVVAGSFAFVLGALFCYFAVLPPMFRFLLNEEEGSALEERLETARLRAEDSVRLLRLGEVERAGKAAQAASEALRLESEGPVVSVVMPATSVEVKGRLEGLGKLLDAAADGVGPTGRSVLRQAVEKRQEAVESFLAQDYSKASAAMDEAAGLLAGLVPTRTEEMAGLWRLQKELASGEARHAAVAWTRPMLSMAEQLSLVLVLLLAFGIIFELPLVMAVLGMVGIIRSNWLMKYQRHAVVVCLIVAAILTPTGDVVNLSLMAGPMLLCYELGVLAVWVVELRRKRETALVASEPSQ